MQKLRQPLKSIIEELQARNKELEEMIAISKINEALHLIQTQDIIAKTLI